MTETSWIIVALSVVLIGAVFWVFRKNARGEITGKINRNEATFSAKTSEGGDNKARITGVNLESATNVKITARGAGAEVSNVSAKGSSDAEIKAEK